MQSDWLEVLYILAGIIGGGALIYRRGKRQPEPTPQPPVPPQKPPAERYDHEGTIEDVERKRAHNEADADSIPDSAASDAWRDF